MIELEIARILRSIADRIDAGLCNMTESELLESLQTLEKFDTAARMSKEQACLFLNISRSTFDSLIRAGEIPRGKKISGFKELFWIKSDLIKYDSKRLEKTGTNNI